jgi:bacterioferritin
MPQVSPKDAAALEELVRGLDDLAREYQAIIQYVIYSQKLDGAECMNIAAQLALHAHQELDHALAIAQLLDYMGAYPRTCDTVKCPGTTRECSGPTCARKTRLSQLLMRIQRAEALGEIAWRRSSEDRARGKDPVDWRRR